VQRKEAILAGQYSRGDVLRADFDPAKGSEPAKVRPCVVIQNDVGNKYSPVTIVAAITAAGNVPKSYPVDVPVSKPEGGLTKDSVIQCNLIRRVDKTRIQQCTGKLSEVTMRKVDVALKISLALR
jgi:mRNA interferase MazF